MNPKNACCCRSQFNQADVNHLRGGWLGNHRAAISRAGAAAEYISVNRSVYDDEFQFSRWPLICFDGQMAPLLLRSGFRERRKTGVAMATERERERPANRFDETKRRRGRNRVTLIVELAEILEETGQHVGLLTGRFESVDSDGDGHGAHLLRNAQRAEIARRDVTNVAQQIVQLFLTRSLLDGRTDGRQEQQQQQQQHVRPFCFHHKKKSKEIREK